MLAINDLHVAYGQSEVLHGLNVSVAPNEIVAIMGRNGMGKTTLMKSLMGIVPTKSGSVTMEGAELSKLPSYERVAKGLAYVPQGRMIFSTMTVKENIETGLVVSGGSECAGRHLRTVSGAARNEGPPRRQPLRRPAAAARDRARARDQAEGVAAGRADRRHPAVDHQGHGAHAAPHPRRARGLSIVVSEQVLSFALDIADRVLVIENGEIVRDDPRDSVDAAQISKYLSV